MMDDMKPTPIEDPDSRRRMDELRDQLNEPYRELVERIARDSTSAEAWKLMHAKMAHDGAMRRSLYQLEWQEQTRRTITRIAWWGLGTVAAILFLIATQCTGPYGGAVLDDPHHYSRHPPARD